MTSLLSIIIPLYNKRDCILKTLESILCQKIKDYEIIIVDDGSSDNSLQVVQGVNNNQIRVFKKENGGPASARNYGVKMAQGEWILFLDADDTLEEGVLNMISDDIQKHKSVDVFCYNLYLKQNNIKTLFIDSHKKGYLFFPFLSWYNETIYPRTGNMVCKKAVMQEEPYNEKYRRWEDVENTFRLMRRYRFYANPIPLFTYNRDNIEASKPRENLSEDFCCNLQPKGKSLFEKLAQYKLFQEACAIYPESIEQLYGDAFKKPTITQTIRLLKLYRRTKDKIFRLIGI